MSGTCSPIRARRASPAQEKDRTIKHIMGTVLRTASVVVLVGACLALLAGKDDIRKFRRMRNKRAGGMA